MEENKQFGDNETSTEDISAGEELNQSGPASAESAPLEQEVPLSAGAPATATDSSVDYDQFSGERQARRRKILLLGGILGALLLLALAYFLLWPSLEKNIGKTGPALIKSALEKNEALKSYKYNGVVDIDVSGVGDKKESFKISMIADGATAKNAQGTLDNWGSYDLQSTTNNNQEQFKVKFDFATADKTLFFKLNDFRYNLDSTASAEEKRTKAQTDATVEAFKNSWYFLSDESLKELLAADDEKISEKALSAQTGFNLKFSNYNIFNFVKDLGAEKVGGEDAYHYEVSWNTDEVARLVVDAAKETAESKENQGSKTSVDDYLKENQQELGRFKEAVNLALQKSVSEIWIGKKSGQILRFKMTGEWDKEALIAIILKVSPDAKTSDLTETPARMGLKMDYVFSDFDQAQVNKPENAKDFKKILNGFKENTSGDLNSGPDRDQDGLSDAAEARFGTDPDQADTDGDGYKDGDEVKNGYDPMVPGSARLDMSKILNQ